MDQMAVLQQITQYINQLFHEDASGHDAVHMKRVAKWARRLALDEGEDPFLCEVAAWLHDVGDYKLFRDPAKVIEERNQWLFKLGFSTKEKDIIHDAIATVSFSKGSLPSSRIGAIVQDADRLDAIGAVGIARAFAFGGANNQPIYNEDGLGSIDHFHEKLLRLKKQMNTENGRIEAEKRHQFMLHFLEEFHREQ
ncbi:uncharacterized protein SAMN05192559_104213 [Halobacillus karajensis]|uniref:HD domain-containing protein n=1 Tax=Halobacillus karajensis TaxID=195088 RepID=UPI0008A7AC92|nr:HD domain-containing protein [Halobacillus karajensis]SEH80297.1 uncharacterized protein SAMN05192559_104213 [Halobacillus karajensis]